ncbi:hypothetical protein D4764_06G0009330 [Takifugu flavidus]|uniref:Transmembrane protein 109 n=2 Tax=Takifugu flavidus TaxID=433684 RepID=A0A5C6MWS3_9TELE|nr:hypothetical protein D4764_06G0009330 [Takifugu flavidus]
MAVAVSRDLKVHMLEDVNTTKLVDRQQALRAAIQKGEPKCLGVTQLMLGLMVMSYSIPLHLTEVTEVVRLLVPWWSGLAFLTAGISGIILDKHCNMKILGTCLMTSLVSAVLSVVAVVLYSVDLIRNPEVPCVKLPYDACDDQYYAVKLSRGVKWSLCVFTLAETVVSLVLCGLLFKRRHSFAQYNVYFRNTNESVITHESQQGADVCRSVMRSKVCPRDHILYGRNFSSPLQIHEQIMAFSWVRRGLWVLIAALICVSAERGPESRSGLILELQAALNELVEDGKGYLGKLAGKQTVLSVSKAFSLVLASVAENVAAGLNVLLQYVSHFLQTAGIQVDIPIHEVTPEGLVFVTQWVLTALIGYWMLSLAFHLVTKTLRQAFWLLKVSAALACFVYILSDRSVATETIAIRMGVLVLVCFLLGVGPSGGTNVTDKTSQLEEQVMILENRLREMERWRRRDE